MKGEENNFTTAASEEIEQKEEKDLQLTRNQLI